MQGDYTHPGVMAAIMKIRGPVEIILRSGGCIRKGIVFVDPVRW